jgi:hypothetical protein
MSAAIAAMTGVCTKIYHLQMVKIATNPNPAEVKARRCPAQPHPNRPNRSAAAVTLKPRSRRAYFHSQIVEFPVRIAHPPCSQWVTSSVLKGAFLAVRKRSLLHLGVLTLTLKITSDPIRVAGLFGQRQE